MQACRYGCTHEDEKPFLFRVPCSLDFACSEPPTLTGLCPLLIGGLCVAGEKPEVVLGVCSLNLRSMTALHQLAAHGRKAFSNE